MSNQRHTPGPWEVRESKGDVWVCPVLHRPESGASVNSINGGCSIARFYGDDARCNGRLAASAPELLDALKPFANLLKDHHDHLPDDQPIYGINDSTITVGDLRRAVDAIAKATGAA